MNGYRRRSVGEDNATFVSLVRSHSIMARALTLNATALVQVAGYNPDRKGLTVFNNHATANVRIFAREGENDWFVQVAPAPGLCYWESPFNYCDELWAMTDVAPAAGETIRVAEYV